MATFGLGRAEMKCTPISTNQGGNVLSRYIPQGDRQIPGYTGHVPGNRKSDPGLGKTFGSTTESLMSPSSASSSRNYPQATNNPRKRILDTLPKPVR